MRVPLGKARSQLICVCLSLSILLIQYSDNVSAFGLVGSKEKVGSLNDSIMSAPYKVKVTFNKMKVSNPFEGAFSGDGEFDIVAYVQGKKISLTDLSTPSPGLWDVSHAETVYFKPGASITVDIPPSYGIRETPYGPRPFLPLSIFTVGTEVDGCGRTKYPTDVSPRVLKILDDHGYGDVAGRHLSSLSIELSKLVNTDCFNKNDALGRFFKFYDLNFDLGLNKVLPSGPTVILNGGGLSSETNPKYFDRLFAGDFFLSIDITVTPPLGPVEATKPSPPE